MLWVDNFSKFLSRTVPTLSKDIFSTCLWTGSCMFPTSLPRGTDGVKKDRTGRVAPAMPKDLFTHQDDVIKTVTYMGQHSRDYFNTSFVRKYAVNNIPPKLDVRKFPELKENFNYSTYRVRDLKPKELIEENIGSNRGLLSILRKLYDEHKMDNDECKRYITINADENIYYRILKVYIVWLIYVNTFKYQ